MHVIPLKCIAVTFNLFKTFMACFIHVCLHAVHTHVPECAPAKEGKIIRIKIYRMILVFSMTERF